MSLWVCSKWNERPTNSEKWEVLSEHDHGYKVVVPKPLALGTESWFPKSDYRPCEPPERWEDVTKHCNVGFFRHDQFKVDSHKCLNDYGYIVDASNGEVNVLTSPSNGYRLRKVEFGAHGNWGFVVEKKVAT